MDRIGRVVGSYEIVERIGEGGMGTVYRALDPMLDREVAVKAIRPELARDPHVAERFRAEARLLARVSHPAIATIYSFFEDGGELFLAMEFVRGRTLASSLKERGALPWQEAVALLAAALPGIEQVHRLGIVHRDLKPDNLMLTESGAIKVMDFGIARAADAARLTRTGLMVGTLRYMAPEQMRGEPGDRRSDVYALGAVLYEMLTGRVPFASESEYEVIRAQVEEAPAPPSSLVPGLPAWLDAAVLRALAKDPAERFESAEAMRAVLAAGGRPASQATMPQRTAEIASLPTAARPAAAAPPAAAASSYRPIELGRPRRLGAWLGLAAALSLVVAAALGLWALRARGVASPPAVTLPVPPATSVTAPAPAAPSPSVASTPPSAGSALSTSPAEPRTESAGSSPASGAADPSGRSGTAPVRPLGRWRRPVAMAAGRSGAPASGEPASSSGAAPALSPPTAAAAAATPMPAAETASPAAPAASPEVMERLGELRATARDLAAASRRLSESYGRFLAPKRGSGGRLTFQEARLQNAVDDIAVAAERFRNRLRPNAPAPTAAAGDRRAEVLVQVRRMALGGQQVERLIRLVQPGPEVEDAWHDVRRLSRQAVEILDR